MALILASGSPRRRELLALITPDYIVRPSTVDESTVTAPNPAQLARAVSQLAAVQRATAAIPPFISLSMSISISIPIP